MYKGKSMKTIVLAALMIVLVSTAPVLSTQNEQAKTASAPETPAATAEGKVLWQYNTHG